MCSAPVTKGQKIAFGYSVNAKLLEGVPPEVAEGIFTISPSPAEGSNAYKRLVKLIGVDSPDPYTTQVYDQINLILMAIAAGGDSSGTAIKGQCPQGEPGRRRRDGRQRHRWLEADRREEGREL